MQWWIPNNIFYYYQNSGYFEGFSIENNLKNRDKLTKLAFYKIVLHFLNASNNKLLA